MCSGASRRAKGARCSAGRVQWQRYSHHQPHDRWDGPPFVGALGKVRPGWREGIRRGVEGGWNWGGNQEVSGGEGRNSSRHASSHTSSFVALRYGCVKRLRDKPLLAFAGTDQFLRIQVSVCVRIEVWTPRCTSVEDGTTRLDPSCLLSRALSARASSR